MTKLDELVQKAIEKYGVTEITKSDYPFRVFLTWNLRIEGACYFDLSDRWVVYHHVGGDHFSQLGEISKEYVAVLSKKLYGNKPLSSVDQLLLELEKEDA